MIKLYLSRDKQRIAVNFGGPNFLLCKEILKDHHFKYTPEFEYFEKVWVKEAVSCKDALEELLDVETFDISEDIFKAMEIKPETERFRIAYNEDVVGGSPKGDYQVNAIKQGLKQSRLYFAHKPGLGKTFIVTGTLNHLMHEKMIDRILVVAPTESIYNFRRELLRFNTFGLKKEEIYIANAARREPFQPHIRVVIMTFRSFLMVSDDAYFAKFKKRSKKYRSACLPLEDWGTSRAIVLDEAHLIKNRKSRWTKVLHLHKHFFKFRYLLSGTPYPKGVEDLYSQIKFLDDRIIPEDYYDWLEKVADLGTKWSEYAIRNYKEDAIKSFLQDIDPWIVREFEKDNIDLPPLIKKNIYAELNPKQLAIYRYYIKMVLDTNKSKNGKIVMREAYLNFPRISLALENPCILKGKIDFQKDPELYKLVEKWKFDDHSKLEATDSLLEKYVEEQEKKVIIWSGHPLTIQQLGERYKKYDPVMIHGELEVPKHMSRVEYRDQLLEEFKSNPKHKVLIASFLMLARAVTIVEAPRAICFDRAWDFEIWEQLSKRNHRIGTTEAVFLNPIVLEDTLEERLDSVLEQRATLDQDLLNYDSLGKEQWESIFEGKNID